MLYKNAFQFRDRGIVESFITIYLLGALTHENQVVHLKPPSAFRIPPKNATIGRPFRVGERNSVSSFAATATSPPGSTRCRRCSCCASCFALQVSRITNPSS